MEELGWDRFEMKDKYSSAYRAAATMSAILAKEKSETEDKENRKGKDDGEEAEETDGTRCSYEFTFVCTCIYMFSNRI